MLDTISIINITLSIIAIYIFFIRPYLLVNKEFKCKRCGNCCSLRVLLRNDDIKKIKEKGYKDFIDKKGLFKKRNYLKKINNKCIFLKLENGITSCSLQNIKPYVCVKFPNQKGVFGTYRDIRCKACRF